MSSTPSTPRFPSLDAIWSASEQAARTGLDPPALRLSPAWRLMMLAPTSPELTLELITREVPRSHVIEGGHIVSAHEAADVPEEVKSLLRGAVLRTQHSLADSAGRTLAYVTSWSSEGEFQSGEGLAQAKAVRRLVYGHCSTLELLFKEAGPLWGRVVGGRSSVSYEVFSPHLASFIGSPGVSSAAAASVNHSHSRRVGGEVSSGDAHELGIAM